MNTFTVVGIDLAKAHWQIHANPEKGKPFRKTMRPEKAMAFLANLQKCIVAMEVCGSSNFWARKIETLGHDVKQIPPQYVRAFVRGNHNDVRDAEAIADAAMRPNIRPVPIKKEWEQDLQNLHRIRERLKGSRIALSNQIRGILYEYGITIRQGNFSLRIKLAELLEKRELSEMLLEELEILRDDFLDLEKKLKRLDKKLEVYAKTNDTCQRLMTIPGVGPMISTAILAGVSDAGGFRNGRHMACWLGLVPGHCHTGGPTRKVIMLGITKRGDRYLRTLLIQGARAWLLASSRQKTKAAEKAQKLLKEKGFNKAAVIIAHRNAKMIWALLTSDERYNAAKAA